MATFTLIPRSGAISAKKVSALDWEKYFSSDILNNYIKNGFTLSAGAGLDVNIAAGVGKLLGLYISTDISFDLTGLTASTTNYIYAQLSRDGNGVAQSWSFVFNTTGTPPADSFLIGQAVTNGTNVTSVDNTVGLTSPLALVPTGTILTYAGKASTVPVGYLLCDGSAVSRTTYGHLFAVLGSSFGAGDGSTTFNVPDFRDRFPRGAKTEQIYNVNTGATTEKIDSVDKIRAGAKITAAPLIGFQVRKVKFFIRKVGAPTGNYTVSIRDGSDVVVVSATFSASALSGTAAFVEHNLGSPVLLGTNYRILIEYSGGDTSNYIELSRDTAVTTTGLSYTTYVASYTDTATASPRMIFDSTVGTAEPAGPAAGETNHTLSVAEMPSHGHTQDPHSHQGVTTAGGVVTGYVLGNTNNATSVNATATNQNTGGGASHENRPQFNDVHYIVKT